LLTALQRWFADNILELGREMRLSYLPPLMVYVAAGVSGLTGIVGTFFVKEYLGLSAAFLAALGFWAGIPWALKMPLGHLVDLIWRHKAGLVWLGADTDRRQPADHARTGGQPAAHGRADVHRSLVRALRPALAGRLCPAGRGRRRDDRRSRAARGRTRPAAATRAATADEHHTADARPRRHHRWRRSRLAGQCASCSRAPRACRRRPRTAIYAEVYGMALVIPAISVAGVLLAALLKRRDAHGGCAPAASTRPRCAPCSSPPLDPVRPNWWILGGSLLFVAISLSVGLAQLEFSQEIIFCGSFASSPS
jgi:hypothetical protein